MWAYSLPCRLDSKNKVFIAFRCLELLGGGGNSCISISTVSTLACVTFLWKMELYTWFSCGLLSHTLCVITICCVWESWGEKKKEKKKVYITDGQKYTVPFVLFVTAKKILLGLCCSITEWNQALVSMETCCGCVTTFIEFSLSDELCKPWFEFTSVFAWTCVCTVSYIYMCISKTWHVVLNHWTACVKSLCTWILNALWLPQ